MTPTQTQSLRDLRKLAMQALYLIDLTGNTDAEHLFEALDEPVDENETAPPPEVRPPAIELALAAWEHRKVADERITQLAPDWPTHRQPPVDRAILRLAYHELSTGRVNPRIAINEAVELAKRFSNEHAPPFINGVLDKLAKQLAQHPEARDAATHKMTTDDWLNDALKA